jgi:hypothetical protein
MGQEPRVDDDDVLDAIKRLVAAGEYLDQLYGRPGYALEGGGAFIEGPGGELQREYRRGSGEYEEAKKAGMIMPLPPLQPARAAVVEWAETELGYALPSLLRRLYLEVGNGGFGPGYGILGLQGGHTDDLGSTAVELYRSWRPREGLLPLCHWGCGIYSLVDCRTGDGEMWGFDPNPVPEDQIDNALYQEGVGLSTWLDRWVRLEHHQPAVVEDEQTGEWRGATKAEYEQWRRELDDS